MRSAESIKAKLKKQAIEHNRILQDELVMYGLERTIYRISISQYVNNFTLKGGIFLYGLFEGDFARATADIDLLAQMTGNEVENMQMIFTKIFRIESDDALRYDVSALNVHTITEFKEYHGVNVSIIAYLDRTQIPISIDIGFGDIVIPDRVLMDFPSILDMDIPRIYAYSLPSVVAEKFEAIVSLGYANSRYKDFYDIYVLAIKYDFDGTELKTAVTETFKHRNTALEDIVAFEAEFAKDSLRQSRWNAFIKKKKAMIKVNFPEAADTIRKLLVPIVDAIHKEQSFTATWRHENQHWQDS